MGSFDFSGVILTSIVGIFTIAALIGAGVGLLLAAPFALWFHSAGILIWPTVAGGVIGLGYIAWGMFPWR